ncbi:MAG: hypothetical protein KC800_02015 [Candidatus Eremiobacteraeota bacterium]|nr:hypothetical protein [Candidatus Eremiobacteraeota bacterium]
MKKRSSGFTVVEVLIFSTVGLMLMVLLFQLFITATRRTEDSRLRVDLQQKGLLVIREISNDLSRASLRGMAATESSNDYILGITPIEVRHPGFWRTVQHLYVFRGNEKELYWREALSGDFTDPLMSEKPYLPGPSELQHLASNSTGKHRILSSHVEEFSVSDRNGSKTQFQSLPLVLDMKLRRPLSHSDRFAEFTVQKRFTLRNSY